MIPIKLGTPDQFAALRAVLADAGFTGPSVAQRVGAPTTYDFESLREGRKQPPAVNDTLDALIRLFMDAEMVDWDIVRRHLAPRAIEALTDLGLLATTPSLPTHAQATVLLYPSEGGVIISDLNADPDRNVDAQVPSPVDVVYPAITANTRRFLANQSTAPCEAFLELCGGTGIAALRAAGFATRAWSVDITERSTVFAAFNARLNGIANFEALQGDLYEPVQGLTFDRIVVHPPYVPARQNTYVFRDGGEDGEAITRRAIAGLPQHLRPGGRFYCTCLATDRRDAPLEQRIRAMLGERQAEFDVLVTTTGEFEPLNYYTRKAVDKRGTFAEIGDWFELFQRLEVTQLVHGSMLVRRHGGDRPPVTVRRQLGRRLGPMGCDEWLLGWEVAATDPGFPATLWASRPWASASAEVSVALRSMDGAPWAPVRATMRTDWPFPIVVEAPPVGAALLGRCDGQITVRDHLAFFRDAGALPPDAEDARFLDLVKTMISAGVLGLDEFRFPPPPDRPGVA
jgi:methylase of polypeptide subunit release factors